MKRNKKIILVLITTVVILFTAQLSMAERREPPELENATWQEHDGGLMTAITASKMSVVVGEPVRFTFHIFNPLDKTVEIPAFKDDSAHLFWGVGGGRYSSTFRNGTTDPLEPGSGASTQHCNGNGSAGAGSHVDSLYQKCLTVML